MLRFQQRRRDRSAARAAHAHQRALCTIRAHWSLTLLCSLLPAPSVPACNKGHHGPVRSLAFAPSFDSYASGSEDGTIRIWSWAGQGLLGGLEDGVANMKIASANKEANERAVEKK